MSVAITGLYAAIFGLAIIVLGVSVSMMRVPKKIEHGDGGDERLRRVIRTHGNFAEFVPLALLVMLILEIEGGSATLLHGLGIVLIVARILHVVGMIGEQDIRPARAGGALLTHLVIGVAALNVLYAVMV